MRLGIRIVIVFLLCLQVDGRAPGPVWAAGQQPPSVLILSSYHQGYEWSDKEIEGVVEGLRSAFPEILPAIEHLDLKRFPSEDNQVRLRSYLAGKYRSRSVDLAVILDNPALDILLKHRDEILPGVPVVFAGINDFTPGMLDGQKRITGVAEVQDHRGTLDLALRLHPGTRRVLAVHDYTASGLAVRREMEAVLPGFRDRVQVDFNEPASYEEMAKQIAGLPSGSLALILSFATDRFGNSLTTEQSTAVLTAQARVPVYAMHETRLGHGIVGGMLVGGAEHGRRAAALALRVLAGEDPASIPVETHGTSRPMFDYVQLERFGIPLSALPPGSVLVNRPVSFYEQHKTILWGSAGIITVLFALIGCLLVSMGRRKRAEAALRESEERYRQVVEIIPDGISIFVDEQFAFVNVSTMELLGATSLHQVIGRRIWDFCPPSYRALGKERFRQCLEEEKTLPLAEFELIGLDGQARTIESAAAAITYKNRKAVLSVWRDITLRRQMERTLRESEARFRLLYEQAPMPYQSLDRNGNFLEVNQAFLVALGYTRGEVIGRNFGEFLAPEWRDHFKENFPRFKAVGEVLGVEFEMVKKDGSRILVSFSGRIAFDRNGRFQQTHCIFTDITERKQAEVDLQAQRDMLEAIFESAPFIMMLVDPDVRVRRINRVGETFAGRPKEEVLDLLCGEVVRCINSFDGLGCGQNAVCGECLVRSQVVRTLKTGETILDAQGRFTVVRASREWTLDMLVSTSRVKVADQDYVLVSMFDITERVRAGEELHASEERYRLLFEEMTSAFALHRMILDESGKPCDYEFLKVNPAFEKLTGLSAGDIVGRRVSKVLPGIGPAWVARYGSVVLTGEPLQFEDFSSELDKYFEVRAFRPGPGQFAVVFQDITERKRAAEALLASEANFRSLVENAPEPIFIQTMGRFSYLNSAALQLFQADSAAQLVGRPLMDRVHPDYHAAVRERSRILGEEQRPVPAMEQTYLRMDGSQVAVEVAAGPIIYQGHKGALVFSRDITNRKKAEAAMRDSEERHRRIVESSSDAFLLRAGEVVTYANPAALKLFRANQPGDLIGKRYLDLVHPDDRAVSAERVIKSIGDKEISPPREHRILALDGQVVRVESIGGVVKHRGENQLFGFFRDITQRTLAEQEKEKLETQLRQAQKMEAIGTLAGGIAHDFNNILSVIIGNSEILDLADAVNPSSKECLNQIMAASQRAKQLVKQILAFSRHARQERIVINLKPIVKETIDFLRASLPTTIQLKHYLDPKAGQVLADPTQIQQVLMNLCTNAGHAMEKEGGVLKIELGNVELGEEDGRLDSETEAGSYLRLTVSDTGHGIAPAVLPRIFEPYFTTKEAGKGTGLGLSVVHGIVKTHGGMIKVYSEVGRGTAFKVYLPLAEDLAGPAAVEPRPLPTGNERILFVDDEPALADLSSQMLSRLGYQVEIRTSPVEALEAFRANPQKFNLVITDMTMPGMTGLKLAKKLKEIAPGIPIVLCTGFSDQANEQRAHALGVRAFLLKPIVMRELAEAVRKALDGSR
jgi:PAS domain S-box-containing protein